jgi:hypothetical protein
MALTITVTPGAINNLGGNVFEVTANLTCVSGGNTVINQNITVRVCTTVTGAGQQNAVMALAQPELQSRMQAIISAYDAGAPTVMNSAQATAIQGSLTG